MVLVGTLILSGAVNTAIIGSNGVLNRVAEDGVLPDWFRHPHHKFGTTLAPDQPDRRFCSWSPFSSAAATCLLLGEAYAFGVVWSFAMKALSVLVLRYKQPGGPRMESAAQFPHRQDGDSRRA